MSEQDALGLDKQLRLAVKGHKQKTRTGVDLDDAYTAPLTEEHGDVTTLRLWGSNIPRQNLVSEWLNIYTTDVLHAKFNELIAEGRKVLLRVDGPGGDPALLWQFAEDINAAGDQVVSYAESQATSGAMLLHQAATTRLAHDSSIMGSIGVMVMISDDDDSRYKIIRSPNASNKNTESGALLHAEQLETKFFDYLTAFNGMSREEIVERGRQGGTFLGDYALANGFIQDTTSLQGAIALLNQRGKDSANSTPIGNVSMKTYTKTELDSAVNTATESGYNSGLEAGKAQGAGDTSVSDQVKAAEDKIHDRYKQLLSHENGSNREAVLNLAAEAGMSTEACLRQMNQVASVKPAAGGAAPEKKTFSLEEVKKMSADAAESAILAMRKASSDTTDLENAAGTTNDEMDRSTDRANDHMNGGQNFEQKDEAALAVSVKAANERHGG